MWFLSATIFTLNLILVSPVDHDDDGGIPLCKEGASGYLDQYWEDEEMKRTVITLHSHYPPTEENMLCVYKHNIRVTIEPEEKEA